MLTKGSANDYEYFLVFILSQHKKTAPQVEKKIDIFLLFPLQFYYCAYLCSVVHIFTSKFSSLTLLSFLFEIHIRHFGSWKNKCVPLPQAPFFLSLLIMSAGKIIFSRPLFSENCMIKFFTLTFFRFFRKS